MSLAQLWAHLTWRPVSLSGLCQPPSLLTTCRRASTIGLGVLRLCRLHVNSSSKASQACAAKLLREFTSIQKICRDPKKAERRETLCETWGQRTLAAWYGQAEQIWQPRDALVYDYSHIASCPNDMHRSVIL